MVVERPPTPTRVRVPGRHADLGVEDDLEAQAARELVEGRKGRVRPRVGVVAGQLAHPLGGQDVQRLGRVAALAALVGQPLGLRDELLDEPAEDVARRLDRRVVVDAGQLSLALEGQLQSDRGAHRLLRRIDRLERRLERRPRDLVAVDVDGGGRCACELTAVALLADHALEVLTGPFSRLDGVLEARSSYWRLVPST